MPTILKTKNSVTTTVVPTTLQQGELAVNITDKKLWVGNAATTPVQLLGAGVTGDVVGPASATDNAVARFDATTGKLIQNSLVTVSDTGAISAPVDASISGLTVGKGLGGITSNTVVGLQALNANTSGTLNTAVGNVAVRDNTTGAGNSGFGYAALVQNTTGGSNTAIGSQTLYSNTTASNNTAVGYQAMYSNTTGINTAYGYQALYSNTTGTNNTAIGTGALGSNTANSNLAVGEGAMSLNTTGTRNTAVGVSNGVTAFAALRNNTTGSDNAVVGNSALQANTTGSNNTALGSAALQSNTTASNNTAVGYQAGYTSNRTADVFGYNVFVGSGAGFSATTGQNNTFVGGFAGNAVTSGSKNTILGRYDGNQGSLDIRTASNNIVLSDGDGNPRGFFNNDGVWFIACTGIDVDRPNVAGGTIKQANGNTKVRVTGDGTAAFQFYSPTGGTSTVGAISANAASTTYATTSDYRLKESVAPMTGALAKIALLKPVTYKWKSNGADGQGFIAHELQEVAPDCVTGEKDAVREDGVPIYQGIDTSFLVATLTAAIQELNVKIEAQALEIATLKGK